MLLSTKRQIPIISSCFGLMLSVCLFGCHLSSDQSARTTPNSGSQTNLGPVADSTKPLPKVLLVGDSITGYYTPAVQRQLAGVANATRLFRSTSSNFLANLDEVISAKPDVIHLNCGLWDMIISTNTGKAQVSLDEYKSNLEKIFQRLLPAPCSPLPDRDRLSSALVPAKPQSSILNPQSHFQ